MIFDTKNHEIRWAIQITDSDLIYYFEPNDTMRPNKKNEFHTLHTFVTWIYSSESSVS